jgi:hypothetical protein
MLKCLLKIAKENFSNIRIRSPKDRDQLTPRVRSLKGLLKGSKISKKDYYDFLEKKYR